MVRDLKLVLKGLIRYKRTLRDECWTVIVIRALLEEAMPVLWETRLNYNLHTAYPKKLTIEVAKSRELLSSLSTTLTLKVPPYQAQSKNQSYDLPANITFSPRIIGAGKTPSTRVVLWRGTNIRVDPTLAETQTHMREYPSGAITLLTISRSLMSGPIEAETLAERAAMRQIKERSCDIASGYTNEEGNVMSPE